MKIKKILALLLALIMCISIVACNDDTSTIDSDTETSASSDTIADTDGSKDTDGTEDTGDKGDEGDEGNDKPVGVEVIYYENFDKYDNTTDHSALATLGWRQMTVEDDNVYGEANVWFDFEDGRLHVNTWEADDAIRGTAIPGDAFYAITQLSHDVMKDIAPLGFTMRYDLCYTTDNAANNSRTSILMNMNEKNWTHIGVKVDGVGMFTSVSGGSYALDTTTGSAAQGTGMNSVSGKVLGTASGATCPLLNNSITIMVKVDPEKGPVFYAKKSSDPDTAFVKLGETTQDNGYVAWITAASQAFALHCKGGLNAYYDNILVYTGTGDCPVTITQSGASGGGSSSTQYGNGTIYYYEDFDEENSFADRIMNINTVSGISQQIMQKYGITCVNDGELETYMWIDNGRLMMSNFTYKGIAADTRPGAANYAFYKIAGLEDAIKMASLYNQKFSIQYDLFYDCEDVNGDGVIDYNTGDWTTRFDIILNMLGDDGVAVGIGAGGQVRIDYLSTDGTTVTNKLLTTESLLNRGQAISNNLLTNAVGSVTVRIEVDPTTNTIKLYAKIPSISDFVLIGETSPASEGYAELLAATSNAIGFGIYHKSCTLIDNLIVYTGEGNPPDPSNQDNYYTAQ